MSHMGRPKETGYEEKFSLKTVADHLGKLMSKPVAFAPDCMDAGEQVAKLASGDILVLENLRFYPNEGSKDKALRMEMARKLAAYADLYVSDAFGTAHRDAASMTGVPEVMGQGASGYLMRKEIDYFSKALKDPSKPVVAIVGGNPPSHSTTVQHDVDARVGNCCLVVRGLFFPSELKKGFESH